MSCMHEKDCACRPVEAVSDGDTNEDFLRHITENNARLLGREQGDGALAAALAELKALEKRLAALEHQAWFRGWR